MKIIFSIIEMLRFRLRGNHRLIRGHRNTFDCTKARLRNVIFDVIGTDNMVVLGENVQLNNLLIKIRGCSNVLSIGKGSFIKTGELHLQDDGNVITVGERCRLYGAHIAATEGGSIHIGKNGLFAERLEVRNGDSHAIIDRSSGERLNVPADIKIGEMVWTGTGVTILKGVQIGSGAVIGAGAVVTHDIAENCVAIGVPARIVRENIIWTGERDIKKVSISCIAPN